MIVTEAASPVTPWENILVPHEVDGSCGIFRAPKQVCAIEADNDWLAINAWLERHEAVETRRTYRREAERLLLWAIVERGTALCAGESVRGFDGQGIAGREGTRDVQFARALRHASITTTSIYLDHDEVQRTRQIERIFVQRRSA
ncbi:hypothetical protein [Paraburkholderia sp. 40]|uniref:hypothetical protein n=1 Tax=Paraburkholderia sp. 40 TaxID=2991059 RepID=UPI003D1E869D